MRSPLPALLLTLPILAAPAAAKIPAAKIPADPGPGISRTLAEARKASLRDVRLDLHLALPRGKSEAIQGRASLSFIWSGGAQPLVVDFAPGRGAVQSVTLDGQPVAWEARDGHLVLAPGSLKAGSRRVEIAFTAGNASLNRQDDFLYALFVPARAHEAIPCFDQPDLKVRLTLGLEIPEGWEALGNGRELSRVTKGGRTTLHFQETEPLPTYLIAFTAGRFQVEQGVRDGVTMRFLHREKDAAKVAANRDALFDLHAQAVAWMTRYTGIAQPFHKLEFALIPAFQFGGMEHPGAIYYKEASLFLDAHATASERQNRAELIAHEVAHLWFGDLVTMDWFSDVWMKEVFAGFFASKIAEPAFPDVNHGLRFLTGNHVSAYRVDRTPGANPIRQDLPNLAFAGSLYGPIIYKKAPVMMRQLEALLGDGGLQRGLRDYLKAHAYGNAGWTQLIAHLQRQTPEDLRRWSHTWVDQPGRAVIETRLKTDAGRIAQLAFTQRDPRGRGLTWTQELRVVLGQADGTQQVLKVPFRGARVDVAQARGLKVPAYVLPFGEGFGYGLFRLDPQSRAWLLAHLPEVKDELTRGAAWVCLWDELEEGAVAPQALLDLALRALPLAKDDESRDLLLDGLRSLVWDHLTASERVAQAPRVEALLRAQLEAAPTAAAKAAWLRTLRSVALTPETLGWMQDLWARKVQVSGLPLSEKDEMALAQDLALRGVAGWKAILEAQRDRIQNADRRQEFEWLMPSLDADVAVRRAFFARLAQRDQRSREMWVGAGLRFLNHPLRAKDAVADLRAGLSLMEEIQRTGDIFFPQSWAASLLGGHTSPEAELVLRTFLAELPKGYPLRLKQHLQVEHDRLRRLCQRRAAGA